MINKYRYYQGQFAADLFIFKLTGEDVASFLSAQCTYDIGLLEDSSFHLASFLNTSGSIETYGWLVRHQQEYLYLVPPTLKDKSSERLNRFLVSEDVTIEEVGSQNFYFVLGPQAPSIGDVGEIFSEKAYLTQEKQDVPELSFSERELWRGLSGWPGFEGNQFKSELINNTRLFDLSVVMNKGCYPGQETVSKIATRRGAGFAQVLLESNTRKELGDLILHEKRIGNIDAVYEWDNKFYYAATLLRDFRVEGLEIKDLNVIVRYYPLLPGSNKEKSLELFYLASEDFKFDRLDEAEKKLKLSIQIDPTHADAYESLGVMYGRMNRYDEAIILMKQLAEVDPSSVLAHTNLSLFLMKQGKIEEAEEQKSLATVKSFQKFGQEAKEKELIESQKKKQMEEWQKREAMFLQVLDIDADDTLANYGLGSIAVEKGEWQRAQDHLERVLKADPNYSVAYLALGKAYKSLGKKDEAKKIWKEGINIAAKKGDLMPANQMQAELDRF